MGKGASSVKIMGDKALMRRLGNISKQSKLNKIVRPAIRQASGEVRKVAKFYAGASKDTGLLRKSIKNVVRTGNAGVYAVVGPDNQTEGYDRKGNRRIPRYYAHLVEFGTKPSSKRPFSTRAKPFLRPAIDSVDTHTIMAQRAWKELAKEAAR